MEQFRQIGEVVGSLEALMVFREEIRLNSRQCSLLVDAFRLAFDSVAEQLSSHLRFEEKATRWRALEHPLRELHRVFREGEQYVRRCLDPGDWWRKTVSLSHSDDAVELHLHNLLWCVPVVLEAIENVAESAAVGVDLDETYKRRLFFSKKYEREWMEPELFHLKLGKSYLSSLELRSRLDTARKEDLWILSETIAEMKSSRPIPLTKQESRLTELLVSPRGKLLPSSILVGSPEYQVRRRFGAGSNFKEVQWLGESFALKHVIGDVEPLLKEVAVLSSVAHPSVMHYMYSFVDEEKRECYMAMELMTKDLSSHIRESCSTRRKALFPLLIAIDTMLQIARGMEYLHSRKIYHGDLNPSNIMVKARTPAADGYLLIKITGFAVSSAKNCKSAAAAATVNPCIWHAPEVLLEQEQSGAAAAGNCSLRFTEKSDVYSFAMICFELLTGKVPLEDNHLQGDKMSKNIRAGERPLFPSQAPKYLANLTERFWHSDPSQRPGFPSICRVLRYIKRFLILNPDQSSLEPPTPPVDYFDLESSLAKIEANWAGKEAAPPRVADVPLQMFAFRVLEREKTGANVKDRRLESGSEGESACGGENAFNGVLTDDAMSSSVDSTTMSPQIGLDTNKKASTTKKPNAKSAGQNQRATRMVKSPNGHNSNNLNSPRHLQRVGRTKASAMHPVLSVPESSSD